MRQGRKSAAQTKAPSKDRIKGSKVNKVGSASSVAKAKAIVLSDEIISGLSEKVKDFNEKNKGKKVTLNTLKAVFRRGAGAYSTSHRPGITRNGWAYARVNKFLEKKAGKKVKAAYVQDDDLLENGGELSIKDNGLLKSIYQEAKQLFAKNGLILNTDYAFTDGSNKSYLPHIGMQKTDEKVDKIAVTYYEDGYEVLGEFVVEIEDDGAIELELEFPNWGIDEELKIYEKGGKLKPAKSLVQIAKEKGVTMTYAFGQLKKGMEFEKEHSDDKKVQKTIALQHLDENIDYYKKLAKMEANFGKGGQTFNVKELLEKYKKGESIGFTAIAHLKAKGLIPRAGGHKKKSAQYMEKGGELGQEVVCQNCGWHWNTTDSEEYDKYVCHKCGFDNTLFYSNNIMEKGGEINADNPKIKNEMIHKSGKVGGLLVGKRHSEGGIKAINKSNNSPLEMEGGEVVITRNAVSDDTKREFEGEMLTNRQILSKINEGGGGVSFADGGDIPEHIMVSGKEYKYGGNTMKDNEIVDYCGCKHKMADGGDLKLFGIQHYDLKPSEAFEKIFGHKYKKGGSVESVVIIDKSVPSYSDFKNNNKNTNLHISKSEYKKYLKNNYKVDFDLLPHRIQMALFLCNQKLVDNYINS